MIVLMGPQGAGKGTQAEKLAVQLGVPIIATGDILRKLAEADSELGRQIRETQNDGRLVPDDVMAKIIRDRLGKGDCQRGCILDGFPRTIPQAKLLDELGTEQGFGVRAIIISVPRDMLLKRLSGRRTCPVCGTIYNIYTRPSKVDGVCDLDGGKLLTRSDDIPEAIEKRLALFDEMTKPLLDYYKGSRRLSEVDGTGEINEVFNRISSVVQRAAALPSEV